MSHKHHDHTAVHNRIRFAAIPIETVDEETVDDHNSHDNSASRAEKGSRWNLHPILSNGGLSLSKVKSAGTRAKAHLKERRETLPSELFYDLFFVANLNIYTSDHELSSRTALDGYLGFFALLWGAWYQVAMFDVRLGTDSVFNRCTKALQFGVMVGFAIIGSVFDPHTGTFYSDYGRSLSLILMANRLVLVVQYAMAAHLSRAIPNVRRPAIAMAMIYSATSITYLGISFIFPHGGYLAAKASIAWYILAIAESVLGNLSHRFGDGLSFKDTHFVERMGLLTLIILGEGVIGLLDAITTSWNAGPQVGSAFFGSLIEGCICATLILFFLYQLYFDSRPDTERHFGIVKSRIWAILHFPLHLALYLCVEGSQHFVSWRCALAATSQLNRQTGQFNLVDRLLGPSLTNPPFTGEQNTTTYFEEQASAMAAWSTQVQASYPLGLEDTTASVVSNAIAEIREGATKSANEVYVATAEVLVQSYSTTMRAFGIEPVAEATTTTLQGLLEEYLAFFRLFNLVLVYFLVGAGFSLIILGIMVVLSRGKHVSETVHQKHKALKMKVMKNGHHSNGVGEEQNLTSPASTTPRITLNNSASPPQNLQHTYSAASHDDASQHEDHDHEDHPRKSQSYWTIFNIFRVSAFFIVGTGLSLVSLIDLQPAGAGERFQTSYWVLPTVAIALFIVVVIQLAPLEMWMGGKGGSHERFADGGRDGKRWYKT